MARARFNRSGETITLELSTSEALYVAAELGQGNSHFHGVDHFANGDTPFGALSDALDLGLGGASLRRRNRFGLCSRYDLHVVVAKATRAQYDSDAGRAAGERLGFLGEDD